MLGQEKPQDFELIELLVREVAGVSRSGPSTSAQQKSDFESFKARFQSYIDQIPSYLHSVGKEGFFPHFFLGSFSILPDTKIAGKLGIKKVYFRFDTPKTLKIVVVQNDQIKKDTDVIRVAREEKSIGLFSISEHDGPGHQFTSDELEYILKENLHPDIKKEERTNMARGIKDRVKGRIKSKLVQINRSENSISVEMQDKEILDFAASHNFHEIKKEEEIWKDPEDNTKTRPEDYIAELTDPNVEEVKKSSGKVLSKISEVHSKYKGSLVYANQAREAAHHGFMVGVFMNFHYRYNLRVYSEQFAGRGYADIVLVPRGKDRSLNAVPIIIELKAGTGRDTTPNDALEQAKGYAKGFQPNTMRVLTISDNVLCVGLNLDSTGDEKFSMYISPPADRKPARPMIQKLLEVTSSWSGEESAIADIKKEIKQPLERIYHTFPGTPEKGGNYFSRFLLGQLLLANEFKRVDLKRFIFLYDEYPLDSTTKSGKPVTTFTLIRGGRNEEVFIFHVREGGRGDRSSKKILMPDSLTEQRKITITEVYISLSEQKKSDFFNIEEVNRYDSLSKYKKGKDFFKGKLKEVPYLNGLREAFDEAFKSQITPEAGKVLSVDKYDSLTKKVGEGMFSFKDFIGEEAHFQGVLHGAFSYYSDLKLKESPRALILTEFQTGRGKRIDMVVHGISTDKDGNAKEYDPVGLELKGPREGKTANALKDEANKQISDEYTKGVTYKTLTDGKEVAFMGVVFDKGASNADSLILMSKDEFASVKVIHSSIFSFSQQQPGKRFDPNSCVGQSSRSKRSINNCLFSKGDVEEFSKGKVDENNVDKVVIDSEKFLTYVKSSKDEGKNAQLIEFVGNKNIEGDYKYLVDKVIEDQGYERYVQNERIKDLHGDIVHQDSSLTKNPKLKSRLMNAAGGIQLIRGIHGAIVSCKDGTATDCGLNLGGIGWSFASQPIENVMVKITPRVATSAEKVVGKIIPGTLGKQTKFVVRVAGVKFGSTIAKGVAGAVGGVFDIIDIGISANNLVDCKNRESSDNPCGGKEIRDNIASISFSGVSFVSGVALTAAGMPVIGIAVGSGLMVGYGVYSGISNIVEYEEKYNTTHGENWSIFWRTILFQDMAPDVQHLADRKNTVDSLAKEVWKALNNAPNSVVAYGVGLGKVSDNTLRPDYAKICMDKEDTNTEDLSRVIPDRIPGASRICLPKVTEQDYEKGITSSVQPPLYYCENAMVISHDGRNGKTIVYDLRNIDKGKIVGSNKWNNNFLIYPGTTKITGGNNVANRFVLVNNPSFLGKIIGGSNSINILDLSQLAEDKVTGVIDYRFKPRAYGQLKIRINNRLLIDDYVSNNLFNYHYIGRQDKVDEILCMGYSEHFTESDSRDVIIDSGGGFNRNREDVVENCRKVIISPYTTVKGRKSNYTFYVKVADYKGRGLYSEINVDGTGTVVFPEIDLLSDCDQITYSKESNTLSLKINLGQNNQFTLDVRNYVEQSSNKPHFVLIDKNGSNIVPKIERSDSATIKINSFELHSEHSLGKFKDVENHYKKILNNNKDYKVLSVIRGKTQNQNDSEVPHMVFGSSGDDVINFDQGTMFARGGKGSDVYVITDDINNKEVKIDNNSDDEKIDTLFMPEVEKDFSIQQCDLYLKYNNSNIRVKNYLQDHNHRHFIIMNKKGEAFIPNIQSMSCSSSGKGKLVPFLRATQTQNMFLLPKDFADDHVVIDSRLEDIKKYKDKDDLLIIRESEIPFIIRIEGFYTDRSKWENISYSLWNNNDLFPSPELLGNVDNVMKYEDKLRDDYERIVKEYIIDFSNSIRIEHNQKLERNISTFVGQDKERIGVMILKNIAPNQIEVSSSGTDLIFRDKRSNHTVNIKGWNNSKSYRISTLEFDLGLEPITIRRLDRFSLHEVGKIQSLIDIASEIYQNKSEYTPKVETDFKCLISVDGFERENKEQTYQCLGFSSLQDQINFTENLCSKEQIEEFTSEIPNNIEVLSLLIKLHNDLLLNSYYKSIIDKCNDLMITSKPKVSKLLFLVVGDPHRFKFLLDNGANVEIKDNNGRTLLNAAASNGNLDTAQLVFDKIRAKNNDPYKMMKMVDVLKKEIINQADTAANVKKWAEFFAEKLRHSIKSVAQEKLKDGMLHDRYDSVSGLANEIYISDGKLFDDIIKGVINDVYGKVDTKKILSFVRSHDYIDQFISSYVAVFDAMQENDDLNNGVVFKLAYYIKETMDFDNYASAWLEKRSDLEELKSRLPESVKNIVFASEVCIKNTYQNEYLYASDSCFNYDSNRRKVFTWTPKNEKNDKFRWMIKPDGDNFNIVSAGFNENLYAASDYFNYDNDRRMVFTWVSGGGVARDVWMIKPDGNDCSIMNVKLKEYVYAADYTKHDKDRRSVFTWIPGGEVTQGVWKIEDCGSTIRKGRSQSTGTGSRDNNGGAFSFNQSLIEPPVCNVSVNSHFGENVDVHSKDENGWTPLHLAAWKGQLNDTRSLVEKGADINAENIFGRKPIHVAAENNNTNIIEFFLSKGMSIDDVDRYGRTPLYCASWNGHLGVVKYLVEKGADVYTQDKGGKTLLDIATHQERSDVVDYLKQVQLNQELLIAAQYGNFDEVRDLVSQRASLNAKYSNGMTVMHSAAYGGNLDIVKYFVADAKNSLEIKDNGGRVPLHYAAYNGKLDVVKYFVDKGEVDVNLKDSDGQTALHMASGGGHLDVVGYLASKGADIKAKDKDGKTPLDIAIDRKHDSIVKYLKQAQLNEQLLAAVQGGNFKKVKDLVNRGASLDDANFDAQDKEGKTPLHFAAQEGDLGMVQFFLDRGAKIEAKDKYGWTPLHFAASSDKFDIVKFLFNKNANIKARDIYGDTPLHLAAQYSSKLEIVEFLLDKDANDINDVTNDHSTLLHVAVEGNKLDTVKFLLDRGADIEVKDIHNQTPLGLAIQKGYTDIVKALERERLGKELFTAVREFNLPRVEELISRGANVDTKNKNGKTPLEFAINTKNVLEENQESLNSSLLFTQQGHIVRVLEQEQLRRKLFTAVREENLLKVRELISQGADVDAKKDGKTPLDIAKEKLRERGKNKECSDIVQCLEKLKQKRGEAVQRKRRHLLSELLGSSNQPEIAASSGTRPSSWINNCISWAKKLAASTFSIIPALPSQYNIADKNNVKSDNKKIPQSTSSVGWNKFLNNENIALASCVADALDNTPSRRYQGLMSKGVEVVPSSRVAVEFALKKFNSFVEDKIRNLESKEQARIRVELKDAYPEIIASLERGVEFSGNVGLDNVLEKCKKRLCTNVLQKDKLSTCLSEIGVTKLGGNLNR